MARPRLPTNVVKLNGAEQKNLRSRPSFQKNHQSTSRPNRKPPSGRFAKPFPVGVLTGDDVLFVEMAALLLAEFRDGPMQSARITQLRIVLGSLWAQSE